MSNTKEYMAAYRAANRDRIRALISAWRKANPERNRELNKRSYDKHKTKFDAASAEWKKANPDKVLTRIRKWRKEKPHLWQAYKAKRRAGEKRAVPAWADHELIADIYAYAAIIREHGVRCEVDHMVPISSTLVCGLHSHDNLTVLLREDNRKKSNLVWEGMS